MSDNINGKTVAQLIEQAKATRTGLGGGIEATFECGEPNCDRAFKTDIAREKHLANDHGPRREEIDNYPRAPSER